MKVNHNLSQWALDDIKRLVSEATVSVDGKMPVVDSGTWPQWIGAARAHLIALVESADKAKK